MSVPGRSPMQDPQRELLVARAVLERRPPPAAASGDAERLGRRAWRLLQASRRTAAFDAQGEPVPLHRQDRARWNRSLIEAALRTLDAAFGHAEIGVWTLRAAIDALHAQARSAADTDWRRIAAVYERLVEHDDSPQVLRQHAAACAWRDGLPQEHGR